MTDDPSSLLGGRKKREKQKSACFHSSHIGRHTLHQRQDDLNPVSPSNQWGLNVIFCHGVRGAPSVRQLCWVHIIHREPQRLL